MTIHVKVPRKKHQHRLRVVKAGRPAYISVYTQALTMQIAGPTNANVVMGLTTLAGNCVTTLAELSCTANVALAPCPNPAVQCYSANVATWDAYDNSNNTVPPSADQLSVAQGVTFALVAGAQNDIGFTLTGVPASVSADVADASSSIDRNGIVLLDGIEPHAFFARAKDADGNIITGIGAPVFTVAASPSNLATLVQPLPGSARFSATPANIDSAFSFSVTASFPAGETDGCAQSGAACTATYNASVQPALVNSACINDMIAGPDGNLWFDTNCFPYLIGKMTTSGVVTEYDLSNNGPPGGLAVGADGNVWIDGLEDYTSGTFSIAKVTPSGTITKYTNIAQGCGASAPNGGGITAGPDGNVWFTQPCIQTSTGSGYQGIIEKITPSGVVTGYPISVTSLGYQNPYLPFALVVGPDGNLWFTTYASLYIGMISTSGTYSLTELYGVPGAPAGGAFFSYAVQGLTVGSDRKLWMTDPTNASLDSITTGLTMGGYTALPNGISKTSSQLTAIATGPDGNLWFYDQYLHAVGRMTTGGTLAEASFPGLPLPSGLLNGGYQSGIVTGPDGNMWFGTGNGIYRLRLH